MVHGIEKFREYFNNYKGQYAFIGGTACDIILAEQGIDFRATKDFDIVLIVEAIDKNFISQFIKFVEDGGYKHIRKSTGADQFYRFEKADNPDFPSMIELFSRKPKYISEIDSKLAPIHISDDMISLSAILLNDEYYNLLIKNIININDITILNLEQIILFKMKAYLDLKERKAKGENVDSHDITKHKNDVCRLVVNVLNDSNIKVTETIYNDVQAFITEIKKEIVNLKDLKLPGTIDEIIDKITNMYKKL